MYAWNHEQTLLITRNQMTMQRIRFEQKSFSHDTTHTTHFEQQQRSTRLLNLFTQLVFCCDANPTVCSLYLPGINVFLVYFNGFIEDVHCLLQCITRLCVISFLASLKSAVSLCLCASPTDGSSLLPHIDNDSPFCNRTVTQLFSSHLSSDKNTERTRIRNKQIMAKS